MLIEWFCDWKHSGIASHSKQEKIIQIPHNMRIPIRMAFRSSLLLENANISQEISALHVSFFGRMIDKIWIYSKSNICTIKCICRFLLTWFCVYRLCCYVLFYFRILLQHYFHTLSGTLLSIHFNCAILEGIIPLMKLWNIVIRNAAASYLRILSTRIPLYACEEQILIKYCTLAKTFEQ